MTTLVRKFKKAIVTGGAGFIGSHLTELLLSKKIKVIVIDNFSTGKKINLDHIKTKFDLINENTISKNIEYLFKDVDVVFDLASTVGVKLAIAKPLQVLDQNIQSVRHVLELCKKNNVFHVYVSSSEVYGNSVKMPVKESDELIPISPYGLTKIVGETYCDAFYKKYRTPSVKVRFFNVYGSRQDHFGFSWALPSFMVKCAQGKPVVIHGNGKQTRDFTYISDSVNGMYLAAIQGKTNEAYNIGTGIETSINDLVKLVMKEFGTNKVKYSRDRKFQISRRCAEISKAKSHLGFKPTVKLKEGIEKTAKFYRKLYNKR